MTLTFDFLTSKSIGCILDSWGACVWGRLITESVIVRKQFTINQDPMTLTFYLLTSKSIGCILDSWGACVWRFMIIGWLQSQLLSRNHWQLTKPRDLDHWPFDLKINRVHPWLMGSMCMKFHDHRLNTESVSLRKIVQARCPRLVKFGPGR